MRELARREPTFALHVHVGVPDPEDAIRLVNAMRTHVPLLLALSVNSPFWQGRDTGLASARTPLFQAFPRVGIPRRFNDYSDYVEAVDLLIRCGSIPEPTFLWWDVRPQPRFGTVEVRIMDSQTRVDQTAAIVALVQSLARLEIEEGFSSDKLIRAAEVLDENRFLAARDGMDAELIDTELEDRMPVKEYLERVLEGVRAARGDTRLHGPARALRGAGGADGRRAADRAGARAGAAARARGHAGRRVRRLGAEDRLHGGDHRGGPGDCVRGSVSTTSTGMRNQSPDLRTCSAPPARSAGFTVPAAS